jgi:hypothetical protein
VAEAREDCPLVDCDACSREEVAVFGLSDERAYDRDAGGVGGDGLVDGVGGEEVHRVVAHVVVEASGRRCSGTGEVGCAETKPKRRSRRFMVERVGEACSAARAQVVVRTQASMLLP